MLAGHIGKYGRYEIEKKYLLKALPKELPTSFIDLQDTYLESSSLRLRIVRSETGEIISRNLTKKEKVPDRDQSISIMTTIYLDQNELDILGRLIGAVIEKRRYFTETGDRRVSIDVFKRALEGLILAEVEFKDEQSRDAFVPPSDLVRCYERRRVLLWPLGLCFDGGATLC
jgi:CYTH domain-containing protein